MADVIQPTGSFLVFSQTQKERRGSDGLTGTGSRVGCVGAKRGDGEGAERWARSDVSV